MIITGLSVAALPPLDLISPEAGIVAVDVFGSRSFRTTPAGLLIGGLSQGQYSLRVRGGPIVKYFEVLSDDVLDVPSKTFPDVRVELFDKTRHVLREEET